MGTVFAECPNLGEEKEEERGRRRRKKKSVDSNALEIEKKKDDYRALEEKRKEREQIKSQGIEKGGVVRFLGERERGRSLGGKERARTVRRREEKREVVGPICRRKKGG